MKKGLTELVFILDKSGSMSGLEDDTIGGFNSMLAKQKNLDCKVLVSTVLFNDTNDVIHDRVDIHEVQPITNEEYFVGGCTALLDAVGESIKHISNIHKYAREEDVPENTLFVITTDGMENASRSYSYEDVKKQIEDKKSNGWEFIFLAANIDAIEVGSRIGIRRDRVANYYHDKEGVKASFEALSKVSEDVARYKRIRPNWAKDTNDDMKSRGKKTKK